MVKRRIVHGCLISVPVVFLLFSAQLSVKAQVHDLSNEKTLKDQYLVEKAVPIRNAQTCQQLANQFNQQELDRFSSNGSHILGVDLHGRIFEFERSFNGACRIRNIARLGIPYQDRSLTGSVDEIVYYYEPISLCVYRKAVDSRFGEQNGVRRFCLQPLGIVNKYAPYTSP